MIQTNNLQVGYKDILISNISFSVNKTDIVSIIGPNGSGKSTILKTILKQIQKKGGTVSIANSEIDTIKDSEYAKLVSMLLPERIQSERMTCLEVVATGRYPYTGRFGILSEDDWKKVEEAIALVHGEAVKDKDFNQISDGEKQRIMLARAIVQDTDVIVLDEPTSFLDMHYKLELLKIIYKLAKEKNKAILMSLHELDLVKSISDQVVCVNGKEVVKIGSVSEIFTGTFIQDLYGLERNEFDPQSGKMFLQLSKRKKQKSNVIMVQGTMSSAGKSFVVAALCRLLKNHGYKVAPFKSQNMALNSYITKDGKEMGRAQVMQAEAAGIEPEVCMNPILLKPTSDQGSQVIVNGEVIQNMRAKDYFRYKKELIPEILKAYHSLEERYDVIVIEGAGSPAEINLKQNDIVNMGMAKLVDAPVLLVADIDRGGVFAQLYGTVELLEEAEKERIQGLIINKFRGDVSILEPGIQMIEEKLHIPVIATLPYAPIQVDDEDSLSEVFKKKQESLLNIGVIRFPRISNFTDFNVFEQREEVSVHYIQSVKDIEKMDCIILPGSKNTISDLLWMRENGLEAAIKKFAQHSPIIGICGGYQMLGKEINDPYAVEQGGSIRGLELLDITTTLLLEKKRRQVKGQLPTIPGYYKNLSNLSYTGYEIHMGETQVRSGQQLEQGCIQDKILGSYVHGLFDETNICQSFLEILAKEKGIELDNHCLDHDSYKESQYEAMAKLLEEHMDMEALWNLLQKKE